VNGLLPQLTGGTDAIQEVSCKRFKKSVVKGFKVDIVDIVEMKENGIDSFESEPGKGGSGSRFDRRAHMFCYSSLLQGIQLSVRNTIKHMTYYKKWNGNSDLT
jgi:hypothetical protein